MPDPVSSKFWTLMFACPMGATQIFFKRFRSTFVFDARNGAHCSHTDCFCKSAVYHKRATLFGQLKKWPVKLASSFM